ncbi:hypothetical protein [Schwartzia sp. (in: firmicutes)]
MTKFTRVLPKAMMPALVSTALLTFSPAGFCSAEPVNAVHTEQSSPSFSQSEETYIYEASGLKLAIPKEYEDLLLTDSHHEQDSRSLFRVREKASVEAAMISGFDRNGLGALFSIGTLDEEHLHQKLCGDMSGTEIFAKDSEGNYYAYYHPTDVRYHRKTPEEMKKDQKQWTKLNEWAWKSVRKNFIRDNPQLAPITFDNSIVGIYIARIMYDRRINYSVSTLKHGPVAPKNIDPAPYVEKLLCNASYDMVPASETPDGEYAVIAFPEENCRLDFFLMPGKENYVRHVIKDGGAVLFKASYEDKSILAGKAVKDWYDALAADSE